MAFPRPKSSKKLKAAFLDRDGVLNVDRGYVHKPEDFEWMVGVHGALWKLQELGYQLIVVTNQSGIARGYYDQKDMESVHHKMFWELANRDIWLDAIYHCPHGDEDNCRCRKPYPGMLQEADDWFNIDFKNSIMVGDKVTDQYAAYAAGVGRFFMVGQLENGRTLYDIVEHCL